MKFAKLFEVNNGESQVLYVFVNVNSEDDYSVRITTVIDGVTADTTLGFDLEDEALDFLEDVSQENAEAIYKSIYTMMMEAE